MVRHRRVPAMPSWAKNLSVLAIAIAPAIGAWHHGDGERKVANDRVEATLSWVQNQSRRQAAEIRILKARLMRRGGAALELEPAMGPPEPPKPKFSLWSLLPFGGH
jgi:hypothetical protein